MVIYEIYRRHAEGSPKAWSGCSTSGRVALSPAEGCTSDSYMCVNNIKTEGFQRWNTDSDIMDQYETFNGQPVYYGGDLYDSEDSERDDPYALASAVYVEDYNFDVP